MSVLSSLIDRSVGRKLVMGITGLFLVSFLFVHMSGNLLLFSDDGGLSFNEYTKFMTTNKVIKIMEWVLFAGFIAHIVYAAILTRQNSKARPTKYAYNKGASKSSSWFSRNMGLSGTVVLTFLVIHLTMFWGKYQFGDGTATISIEQAYQEAWKVKEDVTLNGIAIAEDTYVDQKMYMDLQSVNADLGTTVNAISMTEVVKASFSRWYIVAFYVLAMILIGMHLSHGFQSSFRSLGLVHKKYTPIIEKAGIGLAIVVPAVFAAMPVYYFFAHA